MVKAHAYLALLLGALLYTPVLAQYEDYVDAPDAPTRTKEEQGVICTIEGVQFNKKQGATPDSKEISIVFLLTEKPSAYFNYYDPVKKAVIFDFYDTKIGESIMDPIHEYPITNSSVEQFKLDLNKDVAGLKPDVRDVVRVVLNTNYDLDYEVQEDYGVITMNFKWNKKVEGAFKRKQNRIYWTFPLALAGLAGAGYGVYHYLYKPDVKTPPVVEGWPEHPDR